jgi:N utilization substance protein A
MQVQFAKAIGQICEEKNLSRDIVMETVKAALASAYKKDYGSRDQEVRVDIDEDSGAIKVYVTKEVVDEVEDKMTQISVTDASKVKKGAKAGDTVEILDIPADFGRIAAQTAKQVIIQRIREAERDMVFEEFKDKENELVNGVVQRVEGDTVIIDLGKATGVLYRSEQMAGEHYYTGQRAKVYIVKVESAIRGPQIILSRAHPDMVKKLFEMEVPEIMAGTIEIKSIAREGGERTKIAVHTDEENIDPVGALVGQRGSRVQSVMNEIGDEKIDIILWDKDIKTYIINALSPAKVIEVEIDEKEKKATVKVPEDQLSLAIGKKGQNVRLAAKLTGWNVDIAGADDAGVEGVQLAAQKAEPQKKAADLEDEIIKSISSQEDVSRDVKAEETSSGKTKVEKKADEKEKTPDKEVSKIIKDKKKPIEGSEQREAPYAGETIAEQVVEEAEKKTKSENAKKDKKKDPKEEKAIQEKSSVEDVLNKEAASAKETENKSKPAKDPVSIKAKSVQDKGNEPSKQ